MVDKALKLLDYRKLMKNQSEPQGFMRAYQDYKVIEK